MRSAGVHFPRPLPLQDLGCVGDGPCSHRLEDRSACLYPKPQTLASGLPWLARGQWRMVAQRGLLQHGGYGGRPSDGP